MRSTPLPCAQVMALFQAFATSLSFLARRWRSPTSSSFKTSTSSVIIQRWRCHSVRSPSLLAASVSGRIVACLASLFLPQIEDEIVVFHDLLGQRLVIRSGFAEVDKLLGEGMNGRVL